MSTSSQDDISTLPIDDVSMNVTIAVIPPGAIATVLGTGPPASPIRDAASTVTGHVGRLERRRGAGQAGVGMA